MNKKRRAFISEYLIDFNGQQAAERAGYSPRTARISAYKILQLPEVQEIIESHLEELKMTADEALRLLADKARNADSESVQVRALENIIKVHGLTDKPIEGELTFKVVYGDQDTPKATPPETEDNSI